MKTKTNWKLWFKAAGIRVCQDVEGVSVREAVERFERGELTFAEASNK